MPGRNGAILFSELPSSEEIAMGAGCVCVFGERSVKAQLMKNTRDCRQGKAGRIFCLLSALLNIYKYMGLDLA